MSVFSEARLVAITVHVWDKGEEPVVSPWDGDLHFDRISAVVEEKLATKEYCKLVKEYYEVVHVPGGAESKKTDELALWYRAFTDPFRGRMIVGGCSEEDVNKHFEEAKARCARKVFTANELYQLEPVYVDHEPSYTVMQYLTELNFWDFDSRACDATKRLQVRYLVYENEWMLGTVWFDTFPVMVIACHGKDCEEKDRWITNANLYAAMIQWLATFEEKTQVTGFIGADMTLPALTEFGGQSIHDFYDTEKQVTRRPR